MSDIIFLEQKERATTSSLGNNPRNEQYKRISCRVKYRLCILVLSCAIVQLTFLCHCLSDFLWCRLFQPNPATPNPSHPIVASLTSGFPFIALRTLVHSIIPDAFSSLYVARCSWAHVWLFGELNNYRAWHPSCRKGTLLLYIRNSKAKFFRFSSAMPQVKSVFIDHNRDPENICSQQPHLETTKMFDSRMRFLLVALAVLS